MNLLIVATIVSLISVHSSYICNQIVKRFNKAAIERTGQPLVKERKLLAKEQLSLSVSKDFVKYSKNQRKIIKIDEEIKRAREQYLESYYYVYLFFKYGTKCINFLWIVFLTLYYRNEPVFMVYTEFNLFPFGGLISFPNKFVNSVSFHFWMLCCANVARLFPELIRRNIYLQE